MFGFIVCVIVFELLTYLASDLMMPAMLGVVDELGASAAHVPAAFYLYLIGGILVQWLIGPVSDRFGRRPLLLIGCALFTLACGAMVLVPNIQAFQWLRVLQGMGLGFVIAVSYPALQELFCEADAVRLMALLGNMALLSPLLGPLLGSLLLEWLSWRELFWLLACIGALTWLGLYGCMPETLARDAATPALRLGAIAQGYLALLRNRRFVTASLALGVMGLPLVAWIGLSPLLLIEQLGMSSVGYGLAQVPVFAAVIVGNLLLGRLIARLSLSQVLRHGLWPLAAGLGLLAPLSAFDRPLAALLTGLSLYGVGLGMSHATLYRLAMNASEHSKGLVSALIGMISISVMGVGAALLTVAGAGQSPSAFALLASLAGLLYLLLITWLLRLPPATDSNVDPRDVLS